MGKILAGIAAFIFGVGAFFSSRAARGTTVTDDALSDADGAPQGASPSGIANKNPFNLEFRSTIQWRGQLGTDGRFVIFDTPLNGLRAGMINIHTKMTRDGLDTVRKIIFRLSPPSENPSEAFVQFVAGRMSVAPDQPLQFIVHIIPMSKAIIQFENGQQPYSNELISQALAATGKV